MALNKCFSFNCFFTQYFLIFSSLLLVSKLSCCLGGLVSLIGWVLVVSIISWFATKSLRKRLNNEFLTSYKRAVLITGCDSGFGNGLAHKMNENGFKVYATVLDPESDGARQLITGARFEDMTKVLRMDVRSDEEVNDVYEKIKKDLKENGEELWTVVNNAGIVTFGPLDWGTIDTYKEVFDVNTFGTVRVTRTFLPLIRQSKGRIVNVVSIAGRVTPIAQTMAVYSMSKHALISFSDALRRETRKWGIKVVTIEPMAYNTSMASADNFEALVDKQWSETSDEIRQLYGQEYYESVKQKKTNLTAFKVGEDINEVIDTIVEAVRTPQPETRYLVVPDNSCRRRLYVFLFQLMPNEMVDQIYHFKCRNALKPSLLRNEE